MPVTKRGFQIEDALSLFVQGAAQVFTQCQLGDCTKHSLGLICTMCSRAVCQRHAYVTASVPPKPICCSCIMEAHRELWDEHDEGFVEEPRREARREQRREAPREERRQARHDDGPVIDVEFESVGGGGGRRR